ncbi:protease pro-enzyme activation domain-containing protein [Granulicella arctica]|uniref:Subtilase family serine protease n=1 Tax=Granulicella arctica TaxID=940613 RepID=A0A7Y9PHQ1_9BACT|nr:protease pro-enzyme activation domain-containing protein [Granulicella arctica]NYF79949.1 subtilase family serine protease [Granulicella arctica]
MRSRSMFLLLVLAFLALTAGFTTSSQAAVQNRIAGEVTEGSRVALTHTVSPKASHAMDLGAAPSSLPLQGMTLRFSMTTAQHAALSQLLIDQQNPSSSRYHQWLTPQQFGAQFGLSAADITKVSSWLTSQGFTITSVANSSTFIRFSGTVSQADQAFGTTIHKLSLDGEQHISNLTEPALPAAIAGVVENISGLDDFKLKPHLRVRAVTSRSTSTAHPKDTIDTTAGVEHFISPGDFYVIYDLNPLLTASTPINGSGVTIAVMGQVDISLTDIAAFRTASGLSTNAPTITTYGTDPGSPTTACLADPAPSTCTVTGGDLDESELDVEWAGATAPSANIVFVNSTDVIGISLVDSIDNNLAPIMTVSYGGCEVHDFSTGAMNSLNEYFQQANAQGITVVGPAGDTGATDCDDSDTTEPPSATLGLAVDFPASSPFVTAVGGTEFSEGADTAGQYWNNSTTNTSTTSALSYIPETVWNDTAAEIASSPTNASFSAGGGGASVVFSKPTWQTGTGVPSDGQRDVPDLAFNASADHDAYLVCAQDSCQGGTYFVQSGTDAGEFNAFGGTSVSTPSFAGILALVEQKLGGSRIGNANPYIYALANGSSYSSIFHDVTTGNNDSPCTKGSTDCPNGGSIGFSAGVGYDQASGWGSLDVSNFANSFSSVVTALPNATSITVTNSPSIPALNQTVTFTATVAHTSGTATPTGTVTFTVDNAATSTSETLSSSGTATFSTAFTTSGSHIIYSSYSGDSNYYGSSTTTTITSGTVPTGSISLSASPATISIASGGSISSTITITSAGGYAGTVDLTAVASTLNGTFEFLSNSSPVTSVTVPAGGSTAVTFTVSSVTAATKGAGKLNRSSGVSNLVVGGGATLAGLLLFGFTGTRRRRWPAVFSLLAFTALIAGMGCSSSSTTTTTTGAGTYTITITGADSVTPSTITASTNLTVTIQ